MINVVHFALFWFTLSYFSFNEVGLLCTILVCKALVWSFYLILFAISCFSFFYNMFGMFYFV